MRPNSPVFAKNGMILRRSPVRPSIKPGTGPRRGGNLMPAERAAGCPSSCFVTTEGSSAFVHSLSSRSRSGDLSLATRRGSLGASSAAQTARAFSHGTARLTTWTWSSGQSAKRRCSLGFLHTCGLGSHERINALSSSIFRKQALSGSSFPSTSPSIH